MYCPCADAVARRAWVSSLPIQSFLHQPGARTVVSPHVPIASSIPVPVVGVGSSVPVVPGSPVRGSSALSPGPTYRGPDPDPSLMVGPLSEFPDWPINDDWRDFAFEPVVFRVRPFFSESSLSEQSNNNNDCDGP